MHPYCSSTQHASLLHLAVQGISSSSIGPSGPQSSELLHRGSDSKSKAPGLNLLAAKIPSSLSLASDEDEACPTCLEAYTEEDPKIWTNCHHHFHLQCIYEWLNRQQTCPMCGTRMLFEELL